MPIGTVFGGDILKLIFTAVAIANLADNAGTAPLTDLWIALHQASPGAGGTQETNEADYGSYARVSVARSGAGWTVTGASITNDGSIAFPAASSGSNTLTHFSIGTDETGAGKILVFGALAAAVVADVAHAAPTFAAGELDGSVA